MLGGIEGIEALGTRFTTVGVSGGGCIVDGTPVGSCQPKAAARSEMLGTGGGGRVGGTAAHLVDKSSDGFHSCCELLLPP